MTRSDFRFVNVACSSLLVLLALAVRTGRAADAPPDGKSIQAGEYVITGPAVHENLSVFIIHGPARASAKHYLTLQEALDRKIVKVLETGEVNQLKIENTSEDQEVYLQSGEIVKGGRQDRTIAMDFVCPPKTTLPIDAFCVEHGRWSKRGSEESGYFASSNYSLSSNALKVAAKGASDQAEVWRQVDTLQRKASGNAGQSVNAPESESSLQLSLENKKLAEMTQAYVKALSAAGGDADAVGYAFAVNGKVRSIDVYATHDLFARLWPKMLDATAVEAVADLQKGKTFEPAELEAVKACIDDAQRGTLSEKKVTARVTMLTRETEGNLVYETRDQAVAAAPTVAGAGAPASGDWIHRNYLSKDEETRAALRPRENRVRVRDQLEPRQQPANQQINGPANPPPSDRPSQSNATTNR